MKSAPLSRRSFLARTATATAAFSIVPRHVLDGAGITPPSQKLKGENVKLLPDSPERPYQRPAPHIPRSAGHYREWIDACKGGPKAGSHFEHAAVLTQAVQLGNVALRHSARVNKELQDGRPVKLSWDKVAGKTSDPEGNPFLQRECRKGWEI